uniref:Uncharacterized protein n=1 Tax=Lepeophtheirus salmonis TaxID=72036 RepID=A0A0K2V6R5_LEPSM
MFLFNHKNLINYTSKNIEWQSRFDSHSISRVLWNRVVQLKKFHINSYYICSYGETYIE